MTLAAHDLHWTANRRPILRGVSVAVRPGEMLGLLGPNGAGKSSLLRLLAGLRRPTAGAVTLDGQPIARLTRRALARRLAFVEQHATTEAPVTVLDIVRLGRTPHLTPLAPWSPADDAAVDAAMAETDIADKRHQRWHTLSGGERQRVQIARALAQSPSELLLDEPTNHLDISHQLDLLALLKRLPITVILALHDLNLAAAYCDRLLLLEAGQVVAVGTPAEILTPDRIHAVFHANATIEPPSASHPALHVRYKPRL